MGLTRTGTGTHPPGFVCILENALSVVILAVLPCAFGEALEVKIPYTVVLKEVERQMFTGGRSYLSGDKTDTCDYAYLENPRMFSQDGRLALQARFNGKTGREVLGKCVGVGKSFDIVVTGRPVYSEGILRFSEAKIEFANSVADAVFGKLLDGFARDLEEQLKFPLKADVQQLSQTLSRGAAGYSLRVEKFTVTAIDVLPDAIHLQIATTVALNETAK